MDNFGLYWIRRNIAERLSNLLDGCEVALYEEEIQEFEELIREVAILEATLNTYKNIGKPLSEDFYKNLEG